MYPRVSVDPDVLFIDDGDIVTGAGTGAALDACLHPVTRLWGAKASAGIARRMAMPPRRGGGLPQVVDDALPVPQPGRELTEVMAFAIEHIAEPVDVDDLARRAMMSRRTFDRRFRSGGGRVPDCNGCCISGCWFRSAYLKRASCPSTTSRDGPDSATASPFGATSVARSAPVRCTTG